MKRFERAKIEELKPDCYILATSVSLTPQRKAKLIDLLSPFCKEDEIIGREDLNNLLSRHPEVETKNFKLWLTSEFVLRRLFAGGLLEDTTLALERMRQRTRRFVINPSLYRAQNILERHHVCVIAGIPGIGKTTLAEILMLDLVDRQGFQAVRIASSLTTELRGVRRSKLKQVFIFDDFLGKTTLDKLDKNEDQQLVEFLSDVQANPNWRFILTTREYILNVAMQRYESLARTELRLCVIALQDYTRPIRAEILYNHIYFSDLPSAHKRVLLEDRGYVRILEHQNYNPRVIEHMTQRANSGHIPPPFFLSEFLKALTNPMLIWDHAFRFQLSEAARHLMILMGTLPYEVTLSDLELSFVSFFRLRKARFGFQTSSADFENAVRELDGNFIKTGKYGADLFITFHNPSVQDYVRSYIREDPSREIIVDLINASIFFEQISQGWEVAKESRDSRVTEAILSALAKLESLPSCGTIRSQSLSHRWLRHDPPSLERRVSFIIEVAETIRSARSTQIIQDALLPLAARLDQPGQPALNHTDLVHLIGKFAGYGSLGSELAEKARRVILRDIETAEDYQAATMLVMGSPESVSSEELEELKGKVYGFAASESDALKWENDLDLLNSVVDDLSKIARTLELNIEIQIEPLTDRVAQLEEEQKEEKRRESRDDFGSEEWRGGWVTQSREEKMFASLLYELHQEWQV